MNILDFVFTHLRELGYDAWWRYNHYGLGEHFNIYSTNSTVFGHKIRITVRYNSDFLWFCDDQNECGDDQNDCVLLKIDPFSADFLDEIEKFAANEKITRHRSCDWYPLKSKHKN